MNHIFEGILRIRGLELNLTHIFKVKNLIIVHTVFLGLGQNAMRPWLWNLIEDEKVRENFAWSSLSYYVLSKYITNSSTKIKENPI